MSASPDIAPRNLPLETALQLAGRGFPVFPVFEVGKRKVPALPDWPNKATTDPDQIRHWRNDYYLVGMLTGARSGVDVLDVDPRNGGDLWLSEHAHLIPETRRQTTRQGGTHYFFKHRPGLRNSDSRIAPGVDVRAEGGFVVVWASAGLPLIEADIADWPPDLLAMAATKPSVNGNSEVSLQRRLPPSATHLVETLNRMPNPLETSRSTYLEVMLAAQGCITALEKAGILTDRDRIAIADAAISWAERWEGYQGTDESAKWEEDWSQHGGDLAGWQTLERIAGQLIPGYRAEQAKSEFEAAPLPDLRRKSRLILDSRAPLTTARIFIKRFYPGTLHHHRGCFYRWTGTHYPKDDAGRMRAEIYDFLGSAFQRTEEGLELDDAIGLAGLAGEALCRGPGLDSD